MDQSKLKVVWFVKGAGSVVALIVVAAIITLGVLFFKAYGPFDPEHQVKVLENDGLTNVHISLTEEGESQEGSYRFEAVVRSNPSCRVTGFGVHNVDYVWMSLDGFDERWYEIDHSDYISHNWPPDYVTVGQVAAEHPEICSS